MSIVNINIHDTDLAKQFPEYVEYDSQLKDKYGEVNTPYKFISEMLGVIPITQCNSNSNSNSNSYSYSYSNLKDTKWLDAGAGRGNFSHTQPIHELISGSLAIRCNSYTISSATLGQVHSHISSCNHRL